jgi:hypothetical protein
VYEVTVVPEAFPLVLPTLLPPQLVPARPTAKSNVASSTVPRRFFPDIPRRKMHVIRVPTSPHTNQVGLCGWLVGATRTALAAVVVHVSVAVPLVTGGVALALSVTTPVEPNVQSGGSFKFAGTKLVAVTVIVPEYPVELLTVIASVPDRPGVLIVITPLLAGVKLNVGEFETVTVTAGEAGEAV